MVWLTLGSRTAKEQEQQVSVGPTTEFRIRLNRGQAIGVSLQKNTEKSQHTDFNEDRTNESANVAYSNLRL